MSAVLDHRRNRHRAIDPDPPGVVNEPVEVAWFALAFGLSIFRGGAPGVKKREAPTLGRKREASRPGRQPTRWATNYRIAAIRLAVRDTFSGGCRV